MILSETVEKVMKDTGARAHVGLFGKHPAWDDHMEDIGLETPSLVELRESLYATGIARQLDGGAWLELPEAERIDEFRHDMLWCGATGVLFVRMWKSSDGRGRSSYPMVAAVHFLTPILPHRVEPMFAVLAQAEEACRAATSRDEVRAVRVQTLGWLMQAAREVRPLNVNTWDLQERREFVGEPDSERREGLLRVLYAMGESAWARGPGSGLTGEAFRVPACLPGTEALLAWQVLARAQFEHCPNMLAWRARGSDWVDLVGGTPADSHYFRLLANRRHLPLLSEVPYQIPEESRDQAGMVLCSFVESPDRVPAMAQCGSEDASQSRFGSLIGRLFRGGGG